MSGLRILVPVKRVIDYAVRIPAKPHSPVARNHIHTNLYFDLRAVTGATITKPPQPPFSNSATLLARPRANSPPHQVKPRVNKTQTAIETAGVKHSMNPFDELSIEEAVRLRERSKTSGPKVDDIVAWSAGPQKAQDVLRTAMAMGADRGIHVLVPDASQGGKKDGESGDGGDLEPLGVAKLLAKTVEQEKVNMVILGKQSIDDDANQTGQMLAGLLGWPQATQASKVEMGKDGTECTVIREVDGGVETLRAKVPIVITTDLRLNEPRYASLPNIMKAKKKPLVKKAPEDYGVDVKRRLRTVKVVEPPPRKGGQKVGSVDEMIGRLKELGAI
ncbi:hypothetical protein W97_07612 [Coniosporium apollinis CBS 100218]|uniref:Probable electron transfer flavoprotein subunit beta n=1 Tax=Coniosporium apollinis (strain CBS 100218) TaxID=1168221 RepID=R7Z2V1_CONA1|nr:uncharacterized protein W97_07612 [Coniosporium apollinis CBS 100218]EON68354.1 hypothetical protein W97_07612 [Coniosporium apollinis CBS 100218]